MKQFNLEVQSGERLCITGRNGAGKSTLLKIMAGLIDARNFLFYEGRPVVDMSAYKNKIAYIPVAPSLYELLTGIDNLLFIMNLFKVDNHQSYLNKVNELCHQFGLTDFLNKRVLDYSTGMKQKLFFIAMMARETEVCLLDEPFSSFDSDSQKLAMNLLSEYTCGNKAVIFVSHVDSIINTLANRTLALKTSNGGS
ncbi:ABC transporter ATP-binding protein [Paenibacillus chondroitinus]|uniref:ABC transporter ATP-binding protein n=1 Tax=Paenibacillus chondroitinus TaxID=59842 RepID=A0ABU6DJ34_9BACL|nr:MULTISPECIES: ABC transporter ATP-binding protein [Paenibacillus]MCY9657571.1 ABC transporter ATP-binding protein [Paenibacillus anseongense]MEB4797779.1 ABC transporter ATP-binding protein [Paenibacillus chondroitinus]